MDRRWERKDQKGLDADCLRGGSMDREMMETVDFEEALHIITDEENNRSRSRQTQQITVNVDIIQPTYTFFGIFISQGSLLLHTQTHTLQTTSHVELSPPGSCGEGGQSGIYVLQFIFVLEAPRGLSSMLACGNYTYTPPISPPITAR